MKFNFTSTNKLCKSRTDNIVQFKSSQSKKDFFFSVTGLEKFAETLKALI